MSRQFLALLMVAVAFSGGVGILSLGERRADPMLQPMFLLFSLSSGVVVAYSVEIARMVKGEPESLATVCLAGVAIGLAIYAHFFRPQRAR